MELTKQELVSAMRAFMEFIADNAKSFEEHDLGIIMSVYVPKESDDSKSSAEGLIIGKEFILIPLAGSLSDHLVKELTKYEGI